MLRAEVYAAEQKIATNRRESAGLCRSCIPPRTVGGAAVPRRLRLRLENSARHHAIPLRYSPTSRQSERDAGDEIGTLCACGPVRRNIAAREQHIHREAGSCHGRRRQFPVARNLARNSRPGVWERVPRQWSPVDPVSRRRKTQTRKSLRRDDDIDLNHQRKSEVGGRILGSQVKEDLHWHDV